MTKLVHHELILAKLEATYGVDSAPTATTNAILVQNLTWSQAGLRMEKRPAVRGTSIADLQPVYGGELRKIEFSCELKGSGAAGTVPEIDPLLQACAMAETTVASTSCTYAPTSVSANIKSTTIYYYEDGSLHKLTGCMGTVAIDMKAGGIPVAKFTFTGHVESVTDSALLTGTFNVTKPPVAINATVSLGAYDPVVAAFTLNIDNKVEMVGNIGASDGYGPIMISSREVKGTLEVEADVLANINFYTDLSAGTQVNAIVGPLGATAGNKVIINVPQFVVSGIKPGAMNGIRTYTIDYDAVESATVDTDFSIVFE